MKNPITRYLRSFALVAMLGVLSWSAMPALQAQATVSQTTLATAVSASNSVVTVSSAGSIAAGWLLYVDTEAMSVVSISGTTVRVLRGVNGTRATSHAVGAVLYAGLPTYFSTVDITGSCTATQQLALPRINTITGAVSNCVDGAWRTVNLNPIAYMTLPRTPVASGAYTALLTDVVIAYTTLAAASTVTLPSASGLNGHVYIIKNESNVKAATSGRFITVVGTIDGGSSSSISLDGGVLRLYSNGVQWWSW